MNTEITDKNAEEPLGWIFYDAQCPLCVRGVDRFRNLFSSRGFVWVPLQTPGTAARLGISETALRGEMKILLANGKVLGGIDSWTILMRSVWWLFPFGVLLRIPGIHWAGARIYRWIARNRYCISARCGLEKAGTIHNRHAVFFEMP